MAIKSITTEFSGQIGVNPRLVRIFSDDDAETVMAENYLQSAQSSGYMFYPTDFIHMSFSDGFNIFQPVITPTSISLTPISLQNEPVGDITNNIVIFLNEASLLGDSGINIDEIPVFSGSSVSGNIPKFSNTTGGIIDSGASLSDSSKTKIVMATAATVVNNLVKATDTAGTIGDAGARIIAGTTTAYGGGGTSNAFTVTGLSAVSVGSCVIRASTNAVSIDKALPGTNTLTVTFSADPGDGTTVDYIYATAALT